MKRFILLTTQRSGSTYLRIWLNGHSQVNSYGEIFLSNYKSHDGFSKFCQDRSLICRTRFHLHNTRLFIGAGVDLITRKAIDDYLEKLYHDPSHSGPWTDFDRRNECAPKKSASVTGFKIMYSTLEKYTALQDWIDDQPDIMIVHLIRRNLLKSYISGVRMELSSVAHTTGESLSYAPVSIDTRSLFDYFKSTSVKRRLYHQKYSKNSQFLELSYEDMFANQKESLQKLIEFFSLQPESMSLPSIKKISSAELRDEIANHQEVVDKLSGTEYESFLSDFNY